MQQMDNLIRPSDTRASHQATLLDQAASALPGGGLGAGDLSVRSLHPAVIAGAVGSRLNAVDGTEYLDFIMGGSAMILGHAPPVVVQAISDQVVRGTHFYQVLHEPAVRYAAALVETIPCAERVVFTSTGSDAVQQAIRIARAATGREEVLRFEGAYHGTSDVALVAMNPSRVGEGSFVADAAGVPKPSAALVRAAQFGDLAETERALIACGDGIAAVLVDPLQRWLRAAPEFLTGLRKLCDRHSVLLIFDEVVTGLRLAPAGAQEYFGVRPDLAAFGKILGGGLPLGAVAGPARLLDLTDASVHSGPALVSTSGTFNANVLACVAGEATLSQLRQPGFHARLNARAAEMRREMQAVFDRHRVPAVVGGEASFWQVTFGKENPASFAAYVRSDRVRARVLDRELLRRGVFVIPGNRRSISAAHTDEDLQTLPRILDDICRAGTC